MAAVLDKKDPAAKFGSQVDEQIAQATSRIRAHDLTLGGLTLAAMLAVYATAMILLDKYLTLAEWVRQLSLAGFLAVFCAVGHFLVVRPLSRRINPLYAAALVEDTIDDPKNSVTGYVEATENGNAHPAVKAAMSAKAARAVAEADVNHAVDHRSLLVAGGVLVAFLLVLGVLFFVFRPTQFSSLVGRAFVPFSSDPIASRTQLTLLKPEPAEPTITTGQTIVVVVHVGGKVPAKTDPTRVRLLLRHNPADPNYEELPMSEGEIAREWQVKVPEYLVQNGFWYKVAAGDAETPEYKVTVRSLPLFTDFEATYEYPKYTRKPADKSTDPNLHAYRGTKVTLVARTNRAVAAGEAKFEAAGVPIAAGKPVQGKPESLAFQFTLTEATRYRLYMTTTAGERNTDPPPYLIALDSDQPPRVEVVSPEEPEVAVPANGQLAVDATVGDDFGIDKVRLRMRVEGRDLKPVPYMKGKSFLREKDQSWPTDLAYKDSADLTKLAYADGAKFEPKEGMLIEFWVEALDNCAEAGEVKGWGDKPQRGQIGSSEVRKLRLTAPKIDEEEKKAQDEKKDQRKNEEQQHNAQQQKKFDTENRDPKKQPQDGQPEKQDGNPMNGDGQPKENGTPDPKAGDGSKQDKKQDNPPKKGGESGGTGTGDMTDPKNPMKKPDGDNPAGKPPEKGMGDKKENKKGGDNATGSPDTGNPMGNPTGNPGGKPDPKTKPDAKSGDMPPPKGMNEQGTETQPNGTGNSGGMPQPAPPPRSEDDKKADAQRDQVQKALEKTKGPGGDAKPNPSAGPQERTDPTKPKPEPGKGDQESKPKEGPQPGEPMMGSDKNAASASKPEGNLEKPKDPNETKPQPDPKAKPAENRDGALGGSPGQDKESPQPKKDDTTDPKNLNRDPASGAAGKPATDKKDGEKGPNDKPKDPAGNAGAPKPNVEQDRGTDKTPQPKGNQPQDDKQAGEGAAGDAKPEKTPAAGERKPSTPQGDKGNPPPDASETKEPGKDGMTPMGNPAEAKPDNPKPMGGTGGTGGTPEKGIDKGMDKDDLNNQARGGSAGEPNGKKDDKKGGAGDEKKLDEKQLKEVQDAAKDLNDPDPKKQQAARDKLDDKVGRANREAIEEFQKQQKQDLEKLGKDLQSKDDATRKAAEEKLKKLQERAEEQARKDAAKKDGKDGKGDKLSEEDLKELTEKARDLTSKDEEKRRAAEKEFDEKLGKEARERIQEELKRREEEFNKEFGKKEREELKKEIENQAKQGDDFKKHGGGPDGSKTLPATEADPRNKAKSAELQLEEFEKHRHDRALHERLGWTQDDYDRFLKAQEERVKQLQAQAAQREEELRNTPAAPPGPPTLKTDFGSGKLETRPDAATGTGTGGGATFAPPGFEDAKRRFQEAVKKLEPKK